MIKLKDILLEGKLSEMAQITEPINNIIRDKVINNPNASNAELKRLVNADPIIQQELQDQGPNAVLYSQQFNDRVNKIKRELNQQPQQNQPQQQNQQNNQQQNRIA